MQAGKPSGHARLLIRAVEILGGEQEVRAFLRASPAQLKQWMEGTSLLPSDLFLKLADLISERNQEFISQISTRRNQIRSLREPLRERVQARKESTDALIDASLAKLARLELIVLRTARLCERDMGAMSALKHRLFDPSFVPRDRAELLQTALDATLAVAGTDLGNVQLIDGHGALRIEAHRGFDKPFLDFFAVVSRPESACGVAMSIGRQVFIPDVRRNSMFAGTDAGKALETAGCSAVASSPLVHDTGLVMGMISTHYRRPCAEHEAALASLALIAKRAASWLDAASASV